MYLECVEVPMFKIGDKFGAGAPYTKIELPFSSAIVTSPYIWLVYVPA